MNRVIFYILILITIGAGASSCKKRCKLPLDENQGAIVPNAIVLETSTGYNHVVRDVDPQNDPYRVSFDGGLTYGKVDYNEYVLICQPAVKSCHSQVIKNVVIDKAKARVEYFVTINDCADCPDDYDISNWVLVPKFPASYKVFYRKETVDLSE